MDKVCQSWCIENPKFPNDSQDGRLDHSPWTRYADLGPKNPFSESYNEGTHGTVGGTTVPQSWSINPFLESNDSQDLHIVGRTTTQVTGLSIFVHR